MKKLIIVFVTLLLFAVEPAVFSGVIDLTISPGSDGAWQTASDGSLWRVIKDAPAGSGIFDPFLRWAQYSPPTGINEGMNSDVLAYADQPPAGPGMHTHAVLFSNMQTVNVGGNLYWDFVVDFNEPGADTRFLSFDQYDLFKGTTATATTYSDFGMTKIFDSKDTILTDYTLAINGGSGWYDIEFLIPVVAVDIAATPYMYLYMYNGDYNPGSGDPGYGKDWSATDGYEEVRHLAGTSTVPEPPSVFLFGVGLLMLIGIRKFMLA